MEQPPPKNLKLRDGQKPKSFSLDASLFGFSEYNKMEVVPLISLRERFRSFYVSGSLPLTIGQLKEGLASIHHPLSSWEPCPGASLQIEFLRWDMMVPKLPSSLENILFRDDYYNDYLFPDMRRVTNLARLLIGVNPQSVIPSSDLIAYDFGHLYAHDWSNYEHHARNMIFQRDSIKVGLVAEANEYGTKYTFAYAYFQYPVILGVYCQVLYTSSHVFFRYYLYQVAPGQCSPNIVDNCLLRTIHCSLLCDYNAFEESRPWDITLEKKKSILIFSPDCLENLRSLIIQLNFFGLKWKSGMGRFTQAYSRRVDGRFHCVAYVRHHIHLNKNPACCFTRAVKTPGGVFVRKDQDWVSHQTSELIYQEKNVNTLASLECRNSVSVPFSHFSLKKGRNCSDCAVMFYPSSSVNCLFGKLHVGSSKQRPPDTPPSYLM